MICKNFVYFMEREGLLYFVILNGHSAVPSSQLSEQCVQYRLEAVHQHWSGRKFLLHQEMILEWIESGWTSTFEHICLQVVDAVRCATSTCANIPYDCPSHVQSLSKRCISRSIVLLSNLAYSEDVASKKEQNFGLRVQTRDESSYGSEKRMAQCNFRCWNLVAVVGHLVAINECR